MSREIKFRAYQKTPSLNHKPSLYEATGLDFYEGDYGGGEVCLRNKKGEQWTEYIKDVVLEQYTGLKDKNGKEIYEGDIVKVYSKRKLLDSFYQVIWNEEAGGFECESLKPLVDGGEYELLKDVRVFNEYYAKFLVVGNIHENPELLNAS